MLADAREERFGDTLTLALAQCKDVFDAILMLHVVPFMVDASPVVARLADIAKNANVPVMHSMMGTLPGKKGWFAALEAARVPVFDDAEEMAAAAGLAARYGEIRRSFMPR